MQWTKHQCQFTRFNEKEWQMTQVIFCHLIGRLQLWSSRIITYNELKSPRRTFLNHVSGHRFEWISSQYVVLSSRNVVRNLEHLMESFTIIDIRVHKGQRTRYQGCYEKLVHMLINRWHRMEDETAIQHLWSCCFEINNEMFWQ